MIKWRGFGIFGCIVDLVTYRQDGRHLSRRLRAYPETYLSTFLTFPITNRPLQSLIKLRSVFPDQRLLNKLVDG